MRVPNLDPRLGNNFIDANFFDRTGGSEDAAVDTILRLHEESEFTLLLPYSVKAEIEHPDTPPAVQRQAEQFLLPKEVELVASGASAVTQLKDEAGKQRNDRSVNFMLLLL
jgi:hypothetical protein